MGTQTWREGAGAHRLDAEGDDEEGEEGEEGEDDDDDDDGVEEVGEVRYGNVEDSSNLPFCTCVGEVDGVQSGQVGRVDMVEGAFPNVEED